MPINRIIASRRGASFKNVFGHQRVPGNTTNNLPGTVVNSTVPGSGPLPWDNRNNIKVVGAGYASATFDEQDVTTNFLLATNFGFSVPASAIITGVVVTVDGFCADYIFDGSPQSPPLNGQLFYLDALLASGVLGPRICAFLGPGTDGTPQTGGSSSDLWASVLTPAKVNDSTFGVGFAFAMGAADSFPVNINVDYVKMRVYYTA